MKAFTDGNNTYTSHGLLCLQIAHLFETNLMSFDDFKEAVEHVEELENQIKDEESDMVIANRIRQMAELEDEAFETANQLP